MLLRLPDSIRVVAVADLNFNAAQAIASQFPGARAGVDAAAIFASTDIDTVAILTPPATHAELAIQALRAGKHVLVEKPLAPSADEARQMARVASESGLCAAVGHNLRFHRLVRRAREAVRSGSLGKLVEIETQFSSVVTNPPAWLNDPGQGGGLIFDVGVHHIDLARYLTGSDFAELSTNGESDGRVEVLGVLENGARFKALWTRQPPTVHTIRLIGTDSTAEFAMYNAISWRQSGRSRPLVTDFIHGFRKRNTGGDSAESYLLEWMDFANAVRTGTAPGCSFDDGGKNVADCEHLVKQTPKPEPEAMQEGPALSVILGVQGPFAAVRRTVRHLRAQTIRDRIELVLLWSTEDPIDVPPDAVSGFYSSAIHKVHAHSSTAAANAAGVLHATANVVAFAEDHCFPEPEWAEALLEAHSRGYAAVAPEIANGNPGSVVSWCDYAIGYGPWMKPTPSGEAPFLPGHNCSYKRAILLEYGDKLEFMLEAETVLHYDQVRRGRRLFLESRARAAHLNFALWRSWLLTQHHHGRVFGGSRASKWPWTKKAFYAAASPLIPLVRLFRTSREFLRPGRPRHVLLRILPALAIGLIADGAGQFVGYVVGSGGSPALLADYEYNRVKFLRPEDLQALEEADARAAT